MVVRIYRGGSVESEHRIHLAVADTRGPTGPSLGDPGLVTCLRSTAKPFQALPLVATGAAERLGLTEEELALACGSHEGEDRHLSTARSILKKAGLEESALRCGAHRPYWSNKRPEAFREAPGAIHNNCSGKHAGMLAACVGNGWPTESYLEPGHPLQREILRILAGYSGVPADRIPLAVDGCGAPTFFLPLSAYARAFAHLARPERAEEAHRASLARLAEAMTRGAWFVAGTGRIDTDLMNAADGRLVSKVGGEGILAVADRESGRAFVLKAEDGASRARDPAAVEACRQLGWLELRALEVLGEHWRPEVRNWAGRVVGQVEPEFALGESF